MYHHNKFGIVAIEMGYVPAPSYLLRRSRILEFANRFKPGNLLEIGCGGGGVLYDMAQKGFNCTAIETSHEARKVAQYITLQAGFQIPILEGIQDVKGCQFDYVYSFEVLEHIEDDQTALQDWGLLLRDGGHLLISVPAHMKKWGIDDEAVGHYRRYEKDELIEKITAAGFECLCIESWGFPLSNLIRPFRKMKYRNYLSKKDSLLIDRDEGSAMSGINRGVEIRLFPLLVSWPGIFIMSAFERIQKIFKKNEFGEGFLVLARKVSK